ncbi:DNA-3-methyladenine glycosylase [Arthrobacter sp. H20]|uniref:DNA-3-methyladenine glycosylase n=1 Tax=Arthrobacter sp. H20 TaxID=1267981 RepID=UPI00047CBAD2|nr:DNA-3-methyladenine glycosylase [Arthrobacter sp. H20]
MDATSDRDRLALPATEVAPALLGSLVTHDDGTNRVTVRITEVEAYLGAGDPGSHAFRGLTARNASMFGGPGHLYVYFTYGMHYCANIVCGQTGQASGVLLRAGEILEGHDAARARRSFPRRDLDLARGPARLAQALGLNRDFDGADLFATPLTLSLPEKPADPTAVSSGPRVGVGGVGGGTDYRWRYWLTLDPTVSRYRAATSRAARTVNG